MKLIGNRVFVGLSGGVDSAVSAALLKDQGYEVSGVFIKAWSPDFLPCTWKEDRRSAMRVASVLDIPFYTLDLEKEYKEEVVDYMLREYKAGRTPNPDVMCNKEIKFGAFLKWALEKGADFVATGHYARILGPNSKASLRKSSGLLASLGQTFFDNFAVGLLESVDKNKDQSYFLWTLTEEQLKHVLFPVGHLLKPEVRELASKYNLPQATRKDSQGLCFLGQVDMKEFLAHYIKMEKGDVLNEKGEVIGYHGGAILFTLGERRGFTIVNKTDKDKPMYVVGKDIERNTITVASKIVFPKVLEFPRIHSARLLEKQFSSLFQSLTSLDNLTCRFRYRQERIPCKIIERNGENFVEFKDLEETPAPGQSVVFYNDEICLGGGVIE